MAPIPRPHTGKEKKPWLEIDLGRDVAIDRIDVYNRSENSLGQRLNNFNLILLNADRKEVFRLAKNTAPNEMVRFEFGSKKPKISYLTRQGKKDKPGVRGGGGGSSAPSEPTVVTVDVPTEYRDPSPFAFNDGDTVALIGNGLPDRFQHDSWFETVLQSQLGGKNVNFRNMSLSGDQVDKWPRSKGFLGFDAYLQHVKADAIFVFYGYNESFAGVDKASDYRGKLVNLVKRLRAIQPNGKAFPRIVLFSPIAFQNLNDPNLPDGRKHNRRLAAYAVATQEAAAEAGVGFVDLFNPSQALYREGTPLTLNGVHLNEEGNRRIAEVIGKSLLGKDVKADYSLERLRAAVDDKNWHWHNRYRATDGNDVWGGRSTLKFVDDQTNREVLMHELDMIDVMSANRDKKVWAVAQGRDLKIDDSNVPAPIPVKSNVGGKSRSSNAQKEGTVTYINSAKEAIAKMTIPEGFEVNLFADHQMFPELANPVQMQVDAKGRIWAASWNTYPKWEPLKEMNDKLMIFEDTDGDGVADKSTIFAHVHNPLGFEFWNGGVLVTRGADLLFLKDTDGDDKADVRYVILMGFGTSDTHHAANNLIFGPDGGIYWQSGIFLVHNHEHPWGPGLQTGSSAMYRFDPRRHTIAVHAGNSPNPHGISFDNWGYHYANDGTGGRSYQVRPSGNGFKMHALVNKEVRPVAADEVISSDNWPEDMQQDFILCNTIGYLGLKRYKMHREGFEEKKYGFGEVWGTPTDALLFSGDKNFRPTDAIFGADGALYIADWQNVIIGHMQHNIRDPNRDHVHGRIYRMTYKDRPLQKPVKIAGASTMELLNNLKHPVNGVRHRSRVELSAHPVEKVGPAVKQWLASLDKNDENYDHQRLEGLWVHQQFNLRDDQLLADVLASKNQHAQIAAATVKHHWEVADPAKGAIAVNLEVAEMKVPPGGIIKDSADLTEIRVNTVVEGMKYDVKEITVKAGKKIRLTFANPDFMPHNLLVVKPSTADKVGMAAMVLGAKGFEMQWTPDSADIIAGTKLVDHGKEEILEFTAPSAPGDYQMVCTFPGHHLLMRAVLKVK